MRAAELGEAATHLTWLSPGAASLTALARAPGAATWAEIRSDPGAILLIFRHAAGLAASPASSFFPAILQDHAILEAAVAHLDADKASWVDWNRPGAREVHCACLAYAELASRLAAATGRIDPENAWVAGLLAPLGWLAVCAIDAEMAATVLHDPHFAHEPGETQRRHWGLDQPAIARRLARRWSLPTWLCACIGHLGLTAETVTKLGANMDLFRIVQLAVALLQQQKPLLALPVGARASDLVVELGIGQVDLTRVLDASRETQAEYCERTWLPPCEQPLLHELLCLAAENRRQAAGLILERLETDVDQLNRALEEQRASESTRLQEMKLSTLAEFAAGASHEINNPLAVISGQAQYLLGHEMDAGHQKALQTIIGQAQRIHDMLTELMQFARPPQPKKQTVDLNALIREVTLSLGDLAVVRQVRLVCPEPEPPISIHADARQLRTAINCLLRNAIEAAPAEGWAGIRVHFPGPDRIELLVEDSGPGPAPHQREHLFDPFWSGRPAGRGRGLGLPTAWRLAREHGGEVFLDDHPGSPTRFVLSLPMGGEHSETGPMQEVA